MPEHLETAQSINLDFKCHIQKSLRLLFMMIVSFSKAIWLSLSLNGLKYTAKA